MRLSKQSIGRKRLSGCVLTALLGVVSFGAEVVEARGIYYEPAPWYAPTIEDTLLSLEVGVTYAEADTHETVYFPISLSTINRGPVQFAGRWSWVSMRGDTRTRSDFGDLKIYGRYVLPVFRDSTAVDPPRLWVEASARIGVSKPELYPWATGGQEIELLGVGSWPRLAGSVVGVGRIWSEPPSDGNLNSLVHVPHATHVFLQVRGMWRRYDFQARGDTFIYEVKDVNRTTVTAAVTRRSVRGFHVTLEYAFELSNSTERIFNHLFSLRFATRLR